MLILWHLPTGNVPPKADLGQLEGLQAVAKGATEVPMINGGKFDGAKSYKDSKVGPCTWSEAFACRLSVPHSLCWDQTCWLAVLCCHSGGRNGWLATQRLYVLAARVVLKRCQGGRYLAFLT